MSILVCLLRVSGGFLFNITMFEVVFEARAKNGNPILCLVALVGKFLSFNAFFLVFFKIQLA